MCVRLYFSRQCLPFSRWSGDTLALTGLGRGTARRLSDRGSAKQPRSRDDEIPAVFICRLQTLPGLAHVMSAARERLRTAPGAVATGNRCWNDRTPGVRCGERAVH